MIPGRCGSCKFYLKATIAKDGCVKSGLPKHPLNRPCKLFEPKPSPLKPNYKIIKFNDHP